MGFPQGLILKPTGGVIPRNGLVAEYLANDNFLDTSGNGYDGVNNNVTFGADRNSSPDSAFVLNGTDAFINIDAALAGLSTTTKGTWSCWVKPVDATPLTSQTIISFADKNVNEYLSVVLLGNGKLRITSAVASSVKWYFDTDSAVFSDNTWTHIALVQNGTEPVIYVNGVKPAQTFIGSLDKTVWFNDYTGLDNGRIGGFNFNNNGEASHFTGSLDEVRIYNRDLSQEEITILADE